MKLLKAQYQFEEGLEAVEDITENDEYEDGTTARVIRTGWKGIEVIYEALRFALENEMLKKKKLEGVRVKELEQAIEEVGRVCD